MVHKKIVFVRQVNQVYHPPSFPQKKSEKTGWSGGEAVPILQILRPRCRSSRAAMPPPSLRGRPWFLPIVSCLISRQRISSSCCSLRSLPETLTAHRPAMIAKGLLVCLSCRRSPHALGETISKELHDRRQPRMTLSSLFLCAQPWASASARRGTAAAACFCKFICSTSASPSVQRGTGTATCVVSWDVPIFWARGVHRRPRLLAADAFQQQASSTTPPC
jgi:hypothetical protein